MPLKIAAKIDRVDQDYFEAEIAPLLSNSLVEFVSEIGDEEKDEFLGNAYCVAVSDRLAGAFGGNDEAMACGTPVVRLCGARFPSL
jgi:glycosyltransferase involved in cell wall biosynthesis